MNMRARVMQVGKPVGCVTVSALLLETLHGETCGEVLDW